MKISLVLLVVVLVCGLATAQREVKLDIDQFVVRSSVFFVFPQTGSEGAESVSNAAILGGERDLFVQAQAGNNALFQSQVGDGEWVVSTPGNGATGFARIQYDGVDGSPNLVADGLNRADLTVDLADAFTTIATSDLPTVLTVTVYDDNQACEIVQNVEGGVVEREFEFPYADFEGNCDFQAIGAIELVIDMFENVDVDITAFSLTGEPLPSPSPTPSPAVDPSNSATPSPSSIPSVAPSASPSPSAIVDDDDCECFCPEFTCGLVYAVPGDDDDEHDDDWYDDDNDDFEYRRINIYDGINPVDDDFAGIVPDDDNDNISLQGGLTIYHNDDDDEEHDSASKYFVTALAFVASALFFFF